MKSRLKINGLIVFSVLVCISLFPEFFFRKDTLSLQDTLAKFLGIICILLGQLFRASARGYKAEYSQCGQTLIQGGPYSFVRNPMYLGILLIGMGIVLVLFKWWVAGIFLSAFVIRYIPLTFSEERKLLALFPKGYAEYKHSVPRIFPSAGILVQKDIEEYLPVKFIWLKREAGTIAAVLIITLVIASWRAVRSNGMVAYLPEVVGFAVTIVLFAGMVVYLNRRTVALEKNDSHKSKSSKK